MHVRAPAVVIAAAAIALTRGDLEVAVIILRDALLEACDLAALAIDAAPEEEQATLRNSLAKWRSVVARTSEEAEPQGPPFGENAKQSAWWAWQEAHRLLGSPITERRERGQPYQRFVEWWMRNAKAYR